jgi:hypothetical protein
MAKDKKSFVLYCDIIHTIEQLSDEQAGHLFKHVLYYVNDLNPETDNVITKIAFEPIKQQLKRDLVRYEKIRERNSLSARMRWDANACERMPNDAKNADNDNDNDNDINIVLDEKPKKPKRFSKPPVDDVRKYMAELSMNDMSQRFVDYYESNGWKVGKNPMKDWRAAVRTWKQQSDNKSTPTIQSTTYKKLKIENYHVD